MNNRPVIFLSAVSSELRTARQAAANCLQALGYIPDWQDIFPTAGGDLLQMLRAKVDRARAVVQIIGKCYGAEPAEPSEFGRVSFTQYEARYARSRGKKVYYITLGGDFPADPHDPEPDELRGLQAAYVETVRSAGHLFHPAQSPAELENKILRLRDDLATLRRRFIRWAAFVSVLLLAIVGGVGWMIHRQSRLVEQSGHSAERELLLLKALREFPAALSQSDGTSEATRLAAARANLEARHDLPPGSLAKDLPEAAGRILTRPDADPLDKVRALFAQQKYAEAEAGALEVKATALRAQPLVASRAIEALELAAFAAGSRIQLSRAIDHCKAAAAFASEERDPAEWSRVQHTMASLLQTNGQAPQAEDHLRPVIAVRSRTLGAEHPDTLGSRINLANALQAQGKYAAAEAEYRAVLAALGRTRGPEHHDTLTARNNFAALLTTTGKPEQAESELRAVLAVRQRVPGPEHLDTLNTRNSLGNAMHAQGKHREAEAEFRDVIAAQQRVAGPEHPDTLMTRGNFANALSSQAQYIEAEAENRDIIAVQERVLGPQHPDTIRSRHNLSQTLIDQHRYKEAGAEVEAVLPVAERALGPTHPQTLAIRDRRAAVLYYLGRPADAEAECRNVLRLRQSSLGPEHPETLNSRLNLASALYAQRKDAEAEVEYRATLTVATALLGPDHATTANGRYNLALCLQARGKFREARAEADAAYSSWLRVVGENHPQTKAARALLDQLPP